MSLGAIFCRLVPRGQAGLCCDDQGVALGPVPLISAIHSHDGKVHYKTAATELVDNAFAMAYGPQFEARRDQIYSRLMAIAEAMTAGRHTFARIAAVQLGLPAFATEAFSGLATDTQVDKYNPRWDAEPRDRRGRWTGNNANPFEPVIEPFSLECIEAINMAKRLCSTVYSTRRQPRFLSDAQLHKALRAY
jgi:hypothetical protein